MRSKVKLLKPIFLFADNQILFWKISRELFLKRCIKCFNGEKQTDFRASYIGASNDNKTEFYEIFMSAMSQIGVFDYRMIPNEPDYSDLTFLQNSDIIFFPGGDITKGLKILRNNKVLTTAINSFYKGAVLIGISAGAIQLGLKGWNYSKDTAVHLSDMFRLVPLIIDFRNEHNGWDSLQKAVHLTGENNIGVGIPSGGGIIFKPDWTIEAVRYPVTKYVNSSKRIKKYIIEPPKYKYT
ncbi:MAG: Type 1 glutamine amidotransferase-like domain-containing protein [Chitinispirillia bacterium]|jgi:hypothetical protein